MDQKIENKLEIINRLIDFYNNNKVKILVFILIVLISICAVIFTKYNDKRKNIIKCYI